jgi:BirA family transcriptional regulator, biotin operon repressor / biotin---[acetyl-CoA-carboxylase] ligase
VYKIAANTLFTGKNIVFVPECTSTNDLAINLLQSTYPAEGTVVITNHQTAGRGQRGNRWMTSAGENLTFSLILRPSFLPVKHQFMLTVITSLALHDLVTAKTSSRAHIKWPNDLLVDEKKICGVLIENQLLGHSISASVIGIGLNVNQIVNDLPTATSIAQLTGHQHELEGVLHALLSQLEIRYLQLRQSQHPLLMNEYLGRLYRYQQSSLYRAQGETFLGTIVGVDEWGKLKVETGGAIRTFDLKEIQYLPSE